jgi:hypothetical protein
MNNVQHKKLLDSHAKMKAAIEKGEDPTKGPSGIVLPDCSKLVPFTGYYPMDIQAGAFLSIDTTENRSMSPVSPLNYSSVEISVSMDGKTSKTYHFDFQTQFDGSKLIIPGVLELTFTREYDNGILTKFSGTIGGTAVTGSTRFNPVPLDSFIGEYFEVVSGQPKNVLTINSDTDIQFDFGTGTLSPVTSYSYNPAMYVLTFTGEDSTAYTLMLGTTGAMGLACSIQHDSTAVIAVSCFPGNK